MKKEIKKNIYIHILKKIFYIFKHCSRKNSKNEIDFNITRSNRSIYFRKSCNRDGTRTMVHMPINRKAVAPSAHTCPCNKDTSRTSTYRSFPLLPALHFFPFSARFRNCSKEPSKSVARPVLTARNSVRRNGQLSTSNQRWSHRFSFFRHPRLIFLPYAPLLFPLPALEASFCAINYVTQCPISKPTAPPSFFFELSFERATHGFNFCLLFRQIFYFVALLHANERDSKFHFHGSPAFLSYVLKEMLKSIMYRVCNDLCLYHYVECTGKRKIQIFVRVILNKVLDSVCIFYIFVIVRL